MAHSSLRFGFGRFTTEAEVDFVVEKLIATVQKLRDMRYVFALAWCNDMLIASCQSPLGDGTGGH